ncbi:hypothetical protein CS063_13940 [Sporanaerobium hydrogeniformans]|uniref:Uncharacterized protein n=1 Tax=Sporanaerobium hydrogeniformans TaxID=3072179 RepID=A0AC61DB32_9FIRM|nr:hypothetical protein [Sporanaerobium hydrogeniformans]PHV69812.1 hypothetical protein CS063_13940 [Sporanaerobium hydrogeniformans]
MFDFLKKQRKIILEDHVEHEVTVSNEQIDTKKMYIKEILETKKLPIVLLDPLWHSIRGQIVSDLIAKNERKLHDLLKEQGKLNNDYKDYNVVKQNFLKEILELSGALHTEDDVAKIAKLNKLHESTLGANQKLEDIEKRLQEVESEIEQINKEIIEEIVAVGYGYITLCKVQVQTLEREIDTLRQKVVEKTNEKKKNEHVLKGIYQYLHHVIGQQQIEVIDKELWDKKK